MMASINTSAQSTKNAKTILVELKSSKDSKLLKFKEELTPTGSNSSLTHGYPNESLDNHTGFQEKHGLHDEHEEEVVAIDQQLPNETVDDRHDIDACNDSHSSAAVIDENVDRLIENTMFTSDAERSELRQKLLKMNSVLQEELQCLREQHIRLKSKEAMHEPKDEVKAGSGWSCNSGSLLDFQSLNPFSHLSNIDMPPIYTTIFNDLLATVSTVSLNSLISPIADKLNTEVEAIEDIDLEAGTNDLYLDPKKLDASKFEDFATKKMKLDGGLWYIDSASKQILLKYEALPPCLSIATEKQKRTDK